MANLVTTKKTYATYGNAVGALCNVMGDLTNVRYLIAATVDGRFVPVLVGAAYIPYAVNANITVVG